MDKEKLGAEEGSVSETEPVTRGENLDSDTYMAYLAGNPRRHSNGLVDGIAVLGTAGKTKKYPNQGYNTLFREGSEGRQGLLDYLNRRGIDTYNPKMEHWETRYAEVEARVCDENSGVIVGLDTDESSKTQEALNGGMATLTEINTLMGRIILNGQFMIFGVRDGFEAKLTDPKAQLFYAYTIKNVRDFQRKYPEVIVFLPNEDREFKQTREVAVEALEKQRNPETCAKPWTFKDLEKKVEQRDQRLTRLEPDNYADFFVSGGTSIVGSEHRMAREQLVSMFENGYGVTVKDLTTGIHAAPFEKHASMHFSSPKERMESFLDCIVQEEAVTDIADGVIWFVDDDEPSPIAQAKIGKFLFNLLTEQDVSRADQLFVGVEEQFNPDKWIAKKFTNPAEKTILKQQLQQVITDIKSGQRIIEVPEGQSLDEVIEELVKSAKTVTNSLQRPGAFKSLRDHVLLGCTPLVQHIVNMNRVRDIGYQQLLSFKKYFLKMKLEHGVELAILANSTDEAINRAQVIQSPAAIQERQRFFNRYKKMLETLKEMPGGSPETFVDAIKKAILESDLDSKESIKKGLEHLETKHLVGVKADLTTLLNSIGHTTHLSERLQQLLIDFVGPLHDLLKLLGDFETNMQAVPDHEEFIGYIVEQFAEKYKIPAEDVRFIAEVVKDHENIFKEKGRDSFIGSEDPIQEAKAIFFVSDVFTGVFEVETKGNAKSLTMNEQALKIRFEDLAFRHIDKTEGKVFRPEWLLFVLKDMEAFFKHLSNNGIEVDRVLFQKMVLASFKALNRAVDGNMFTPYENQKIEETFSQLIAVMDKEANVSPEIALTYQETISSVRVGLFNVHRLSLIVEKGYELPDLKDLKLTHPDTTAYLRSYLLSQGHVNRATRFVELNY